MASFVLCVFLRVEPQFATLFAIFEERMCQTSSVREVIPPDHHQERGTYNLELFLPEGYPMEPPKARDITDKKFIFQKSKPQPINKQWILVKPKILGLPDGAPEGPPSRWCGGARRGAARRDATHRDATITILLLLLLLLLYYTILYYTILYYTILYSTSLV